MRVAKAWMAVAVVASAPASAWGGGIGGTFQLEVGGGGLYRRHSDGTSKTMGVAAAPYLGLGLKFTKQLGVVFRITLLSNKGNGDFEGYGLVAQYWPTSRLFAAAGIGLVDYNFAEPMVIDGQNAIGYHGLGFSARVGYSLLGTDGNRLTIAVEATPAFYPEDKVLGFALIGGYQYW
jgi:hypothetical protein